MTKRNFIILRFLLLLAAAALLFYKLNRLPIFADEAIYIRWAQLILDDPGRYAFFALNDGKTPLFIWMLTPFQLLFTDQLLAARVVAVLIGLVQIVVSGIVVAKMGGSKLAQLLSMVLFAILPFWYLHNRMALMDGLLTVAVALGVLAVIQLGKQLEQDKKQLPFKEIAFAGLALGFGLLVKIPAILAFPGFGLLLLVLTWKQQFDIRTFAISATGMFGVAGALFGLLALHPSFGQLFSRGGDFLYPLSEVLGGAFKDTIRNLPVYMTYFAQYLSPVLLVTIGVGLFNNPKQKQIHLFLWLGLLFALPILLMGKVVYPRYLMPAAWFITISGVFAFDGLVQVLNSHLRAKSRKKQSGAALGLVTAALLLANTLIHGFWFIGQHLTSLAATPYVSADYEQYLTKWSSGHGIVETIALLRSESQNSTIAVATEGYFGTLPDALLVYLHHTPVDNLYVEGIGQPVEQIPDSFLERAKTFDRTWLVVNEHRLKMDLADSPLIGEFCRPEPAPCLQVWDITELELSR